jgi:quinol monooxygenase YgiN
MITGLLAAHHLIVLFIEQMQHFANCSCPTHTGCANQRSNTSNKTVCFMVRYIMSFSVPQGRQRSAQKVIDDYFEALNQHGPGGMRSQCYATNDDDCQFVHIKSFKRESVANQHFRSSTFRDYQRQLETICGNLPAFSRLMQQQTFESIY